MKLKLMVAVLSVILPLFSEAGWANQNQRELASPFTETKISQKVIKSAIPSYSTTLEKSFDLPINIDSALTSGANYLKHAQADITEDNAGNGNPDLDPEDGGWDWSLTSPNFIHTAAASPTNIYGATAMGLYYAYLETSDATYLTAMTDAANVMSANPSIRSASDLIFLMRFQDLPGVTPDIYQNAAKAKFDGRITTYGSATALAQKIRDVRAGQGYENGIIPWDIGAWAVAAQMLAQKFPSDPYDYAQAADDIAEVIYQDSYMQNPGYFDLTSNKNNGWDPDYGNPDYYWYTLGITGLIDAFVTANVHTDKLANLVTILLDCQYDGEGAFSYCYGANHDDEDWQSTAYAVSSLARVNQSTYETNINYACYWLGATQDVGSGGWVYSSGNHYPETSGECTAALYFGENLYNEDPDEVWVDDDFTPSSSGGHLWGYDAFDNIQDGIDAVADGGTVNVSAGIYNENQITINKALTINGAGSSSTIIDGGGATLTTAGLVRIIADGNVTFTGFTVRNAGGPSNDGDYGDDKLNVGIYAQSASTGVTYLISDNKILGTNNPDDWEDYGFYSHSGKENLIFTHNEVTQTSGNPVLIEKHPGATEISYNTLDAGCYGIDSIFYMTYGGADITTLQKISHNTIDIGTGTNAGVDNATAISFMSSFTHGTDNLGDGKYTNIEISYNTISNLGIRRRGISLYNDAYGDGTGGEISNSLLKDNILIGITGTSTNFGIRLAGLVTDTTILYNQIIDCDMSFLGIAARHSSGVYPTGTLINHNNFVNNAQGLVWDGTTILNAEYNWWGDASGPLDPNGANETDGITCYDPSTIKNADGTGDDVTDLTVDYCPWRFEPLPDVDNDGKTDPTDNCPTTPNGPLLGTCIYENIGASCTSPSGCGTGGYCSMNQEDRDEDGAGDVCDNCTDIDDDGYGNPGFPNTCDEDNCPSIANPGQEDGDHDGLGNVCDNCPADYNPAQKDTYPPQGNGIGDVCECEGNFDCDRDVDADDVVKFLWDFGRSQYNDPCTNERFCYGDFECDGDVDATDVTKFLEDFGRSQYNKPCPVCIVEKWCVYQ